MRIVVEWETDGEDVEGLPTEIDLPVGIDPEDNDAACAWLSDTYGWLVSGWKAGAEQ